MRVFEELATGDPPFTLFHYTNLEGALGIVESDTIWASKVQYLNDSSEYLFAIQLAEQLLQERLEGAKLEEEQKKIRGMLRNLHGISHMNVCVCSFSEDSDLLSQWRAYGGSSGVSLGFQTEHLASKGREQGFVLAKCVYEKDRHRELVSRLIDETLEKDFNTEEGYVDPKRPRTFVVLPTDEEAIWDLPDEELAVLAWLGEPEMGITCNEAGDLLLKSLSVSAFQMVHVPRIWDDPDRPPDDDPYPELSAMFLRVKAALHAWRGDGSSHLIRAIHTCVYPIWVLEYPIWAC